MPCEDNDSLALKSSEYEKNVYHVRKKKKKKRKKKEKKKEPL
jgi:hypothetical protein